MVKTGMTRRIDELGRLVIPKEIRKNLKIKDNDQVEITVIDNKIVLNRFNEVTKDSVINMLINCLRKTLGKNILFTSRSEIVDYSLVNKEIINDLELSNKVMNIIENRKEVSNSFNDIGLSTNKDSSYYLIPLIINGDIYGSLIVYGNNISEEDKSIIKFCQMFLENYLE